MLLTSQGPFGPGVWPVEADHFGQFRWLSRSATLFVEPAESKRRALIKLSNPEEMAGSHLSIDTGGKRRDAALSAGIQLITADIPAGTGELCLEFEREIDAPEDPRSLSSRLLQLEASGVDSEIRLLEGPVNGAATAWRGPTSVSLAIETHDLPAGQPVQYVDLIYAAVATQRNITIQVADWSDSVTLRTGHTNMLALAVPDSALRKTGTIEIMASDVLIREVVVRKDYFDYLGLWAEYATPANQAAQAQAQRAAKDIGLFIQWFVTWKCNYSCTYCWQEVNADLYRGERITRRRYDEWAKVFNDLRPSHLYFTGGEPTLYKQLPEMIAALDPGIELLMTTNLGPSFDIDLFSRSVKRNRFVELMASLHPTQVPYDEFIGKMRQMRQLGYQGLGVEMVLYPENLPLAERLIGECRDLKIKVRLDTYTPAVGEAVLTAEQQRNIERYVAEAAEVTAIAESDSTWYDRNARVTIPVLSAPMEPAAELSGFAEMPVNISMGEAELRKPLICSAGSRRINIDGTGDVYTCMSAIDRSRLFGKHAMPHYQPIGNVFAPGFRLLNKPILCWEAYRCSACDYQVLEKAWRRFETDRELPLPE